MNAKNKLRKGLWNFLFVLSALSTVCAHGETTYYVDAEHGADANVGTRWEAACQTIQAAINKTVDGDVVLVTNGVYNTGIGHAIYGNSRIGITNNIIVRSVSGGAETVIQGGMLFGISGETRCVFMSAGRLEGFTLEDGRTLSNSGKNQGGGVYALSTNAVVADCVIRDCDASYGGGVSGAAVTNCTLYGNGATSQGGGAFGGIITDSLIHNNVAASSGGGTYNSTLLRCRIRGNTSHYGGGSSYGALLGCEVKGNVANSYGGGAFEAALTNCVLRSNLSAEESGGGSYFGTLVNCTLTLNRAKKGGCGALGGDLFNCIVYDNHTLEDGISNWSWDAGQFTSSTSENPKFRLPDAEDYRLLAGFSCLDSGQTNANFSAFDFYGNARVQNDVIDRGALEGFGILLTGEDHLPRNLTASTNLTDGIALAWEPPAAGGAVKYRVVRQDADAIDKMVVSEWIEDTTFTDTFNVYGHIDVTYWVVAAFDEGLDTISGLSQPAVGRRLSEIRYVDPSRSDDTGDGTSWATAKRTLQAGIGATPEGGLLLVTNGVYNTGVASETDGKSRIAIAGKITVRSVNGATATIIQGSGIETFGSSSAIRCIYMTDGRLEGFTLEHGATRSTEPYDLPYSIHYGGGVMATTFLPVIRDCVVRNNSADHYGGGVYKGTVANCVVSDNRADYGGGLYNSKARNCTLTRNKAKDGGGASQASLLNCLVRENTAFDTYAHGGGTCDGTAVNCILTRNAGGGAYRGKLVNCTIVDNGLLPFITQAGNGGVYGATVVNSILTGNRSAFGELDNAYASTVTYTCSDSVISGTGNRCADPLFRRADAGDFRLLAGSPCLDAGTSNVNSEVTDYLGHARIQSGAIDIGAVEGVGALLTSENARPQALDATTDQVDGITLSWQPPTAGGAVRYCVYRAENSTGDKAPVSDWVEATTFTDTTRVYGHTNYTYWVAASFDEDHASVSDLSDPATGCRLSPIWYVDAARPDNTGDGTSWEAACKTIQTAVAKAADGDLVLVKAGVYDSGVGSVVFGNSRIGIMKPVRVKAVGQAVIRGSGIANYGESSAVRCVTMLDGRLEGFVLEQGSTRGDGSGLASKGGCIFAETLLPRVSGCIIRDGKGFRGGGVCGASLSDCTVSGNATADRYGMGGGAYGSRLKGCSLLDNYSGSYGAGGAYQSTLENCHVANNRTSGESGGVDGCFSVNCTVTGNRAGGHGGGAGRGKLVNCTILDNISGDIGGAFSATLVNCILWNNWNAAGTLANFYQGTYFDCTISYSCSYPLASGTGNTKAAPRFLLAGAGDYRQQTGSPCLDSGLNGANGVATDLAGGTRIQNGVIDMGAFEGSAALREDEGSRVQNVQATTDQTDGITITWDAPAGGGAVRYRVIRMEDSSGLSEPVSDWVTDLAFTDTSAHYGHVGYTYWVIAAYDDAASDLSALSAPAVGSRVTTVWHVDASRPDDSGDGASWATAFKGIQTAITNATAGDLILVTNGVYDTGVADTGAGNSRLSVTNAITVRSVEGAAQTVIRGSGTNAYGTASAVRCVRMTAGRLEGFTLEEGATSSHYSEASGKGGGVYAGSTDAVVVDCVIRRNKAYTGGGAMGGRFVVCRFEENTGEEGGGLAWGRAIRSRLTGNSVSGGGGGTLNATLESCLVTGNSAYSGGGTHSSTLFNCTLYGNTTTSGGAANGGTTANCIVWENRSPSGSLNNYYGGVFTCTCTTPLPSGTGNIDSDPLFRNAVAGDYRILASSPCVDVGDGALLSDPLDLAGNPRVRNAAVDLGAYERTLDITVVTPTFDPADGTVFDTTLALSLACETEGAAIYYTTDGSEPTTNSACYGAPLLLTDSTTVKAFACLEDAEDSLVASATFYRADRLPVFSPADGTGFDDALDVTITTTTEGAAILYTLDGSDVTAQSLVYEAALQLTSSTIVKARLFLGGNPVGLQVQAAYTQRINGSLDCGNLTFASGGDATWFRQSATTHDGVDAAQSGDIGHSQQSWLTTEVTGPGDLSFWWKVSSESGYDYLRFSVDDVEQFRICGTSADWAQKQVTLGEGTHTLKWSYTKDGSVSSGEDCGWLDEVLWTPPAAAMPTLDPASGTTFETSLQVSLACATATAEIRYTFDGTEPTTNSALYSAPLSLTDSTTIRAIAYLEGLEQSLIAAATYFRADRIPTFSPPDGTTFVEILEISILCSDEGASLRYTLDGSDVSLQSIVYAGPFQITSNGVVKARLFIDDMPASPQVQAVYATRLGHALDCADLDFTTWGDAEWFQQSATTYDGIDAAQSGDVNSDQHSSLTTEVEGPGTIRFWWSVSSEDACDFLRFSVDDVEQSAISGTGAGWSSNAVEIAEGPHALTWSYSKDGSYSSGQDCGWLDEVSWTIPSTAAPTFDPADGMTFETSLSVAVSCATDGAEIRYTLNGTEPTTNSALYASALTLTETTTIKAKAFKSGFAGSAVASVTYTKLVPAAMPTFDPADGATFDTSLSVAVSSATDGAEIRYTLDGTEPTTNSTLYASSLTLTETMTVKARAFKSGMAGSAVASATYTKLVPAATPTFNPADGATFETSLSVAVSSATDGAEIRYTLDGTEPTTNSTLYVSSLTLTETTTIKAKAFKSGLAGSAVASATYTKLVPAATPTFDPADGTTFETLLSVAVSSATDGAQIRYTLDGSEPTTNSALYASSLTLTETTTVKAKVFKSGLAGSAVASVTYTKLVPAAMPTFDPADGATFETSLSVAVSCATDGAEIRYTLDGAEPTTNSSLYASALTLTETTTIKAKAFKSGLAGSAIASATFTKLVPAATPTFDPVDGTTFETSLSVAVSSSTSGAQIRYTLDGADPTTNSALYASSLTLTETTTVKARAFKSGLAGSAVASATYTKLVPAAGIIRIEPATLAFGNVTVGHSGISAFTVFNDGDTALTVSAISCPTGFAVSATSFMIGAGTSAPVAVAFAPAVAGSYSNRLTITSNAAEGETEVTVTGNGVIATPVVSQITLTSASVIGGSGSWPTAAYNAVNYGAQHVVDNQAGSISEPSAGNYWLGRENYNITGGGYLNEYFVIDLGAQYQLSRIDLFNTHNQTANDRATKNFVLYGSNSSIYQDANSGDNLVSPVAILSSVLAFQSKINDPIDAQTYTATSGLATQTAYRYLMFKAVDFYTPNGPSASQGSGLNEIRVFGSLPIATVATPTISPVDGSVFDTTLSVTLACATQGATIRYTVDGREPSAVSPAYTAAITVSQSTVVKARAFKSDCYDSKTAIAVYSRSGQITLMSPVPVPHVWLGQYRLALDSDYEAAALADTDRDGKAAWEEYVADTCPTNAASRFLTRITFGNGALQVEWAPDLGTARLYTVEGKAALTDADWSSPTNAASRFFRVKVELP